MATGARLKSMESKLRRSSCVLLGSLLKPVVMRIMSVIWLSRPLLLRKVLEIDSSAGSALCSHDIGLLFRSRSCICNPIDKFASGGAKTSSKLNIYQNCMYSKKLLTRSSQSPKQHLRSLDNYFEHFFSEDCQDGCALLIFLKYSIWTIFTNT